MPLDFVVFFSNWKKEPGDGEVPQACESHRMPETHSFL